MNSIARLAYSTAFLMAIGAGASAQAPALEVPADLVDAPADIFAAPRGLRGVPGARELFEADNADFRAKLLELKAERRGDELAARDARVKARAARRAAIRANLKADLKGDEARAEKARREADAAKESADKAAIKADWAEKALEEMGRRGATTKDLIRAEKKAVSLRVEATLAVARWRRAEFISGRLESLADQKIDETNAARARIAAHEAEQAALELERRAALRIDERRAAQAREEAELKLRRAREAR